jgi:hypothetical protein
LSVDDAAFGVHHVTSITKEQIRGAFEAAGYEGDELNKLVSIMVARQLEIKHHYPEIAEAAANLWHNKAEFFYKDSALKHLQEIVKKAGALVKDVAKALYEYQGSAYAMMNQHLWRGATIDAEHAAYLKSIDSEMKNPKHALDQPATLYRWMDEGPNILADLNALPTEELIGKYYLHKGFASTSLRKHNSFEHRPILFVLDAPVGTRVLPVDAGVQNIHKVQSALTPDEVELLLDRGYYFRITGAVDKTHQGQWGNNGYPYKEIHAEIVDVKDKFGLLPDDFAAQMKDYVLEKKVNATKDVFDSLHVDGEIDNFVRNIYNDSIPVLTDQVDMTPKAIRQVETEIAELETKLKMELGDEFDGVKNELESANEQIKQAQTWGDAMKQAWVCMKGAL